MNRPYKNILYYFKIYDLIRYFNDNKVLILMYHRFSEKTEPFKINKESFDHQMMFLKKYYNFISIDQYANYVYNGFYNVPKNPVILTIDDGYRDNYEIAYPILKKYNIPACIYLVSDFITGNIWLWGNKIKYLTMNTKIKEFDFPINGENDHFNMDDFKNWHKTILKIFNYCRTLPGDEKDKYINDLSHHLRVDIPEQTTDDYLPLTWTQINEMKHHGIIFGSHTRTHPILTNISNDQCFNELYQSKLEIESNIGMEIKHFCYPNGKPEDYNNDTITILKKLYYETSVTTIPGHNTILDQDLFGLKRISLNCEDKIYLKHTLSGQLCKY